MIRLGVESVKKIILSFIFFFLLSTFHLPPSVGLPAEDVSVVANEQYFKVAQELIKGAKHSIRVMMFEMVYYENRSHSPTNTLLKELIGARKRGAQVEVILEVREGEDRATKQNRRCGKMLSEGGVDVIYDSPSKTTHTKVMIIDEQLTLVGSTNWTYSALTDNNEASVLIRSKEVAKELIGYFNKVKTTGSKK
jgi:phosphatidylserine/phosphatidylglycerophosphate/cardiolipin synthase-like enzyme